MGNALTILSWFVLGGLGIGGGAIALAWGLFGDRPGGRRRCPRCWYFLECRSSKRCPECGYQAKHEQELRRTRRRPRTITVGALCVLIGVAGCITPRVRERGWWSVVPMTAKIWMLEYLDALTHETVWDEVYDRCYRGELWRWQRLLVTRSCIRILDKTLEGHGDEQYAMTYGALECLRELGPDAQDAVPTLLEMLDIDYRNWRVMAAAAIGKIDPENDQALRRIGERLVREEGYWTAQIDYLSTLQEVGPVAIVAIPSIVKAVRQQPYLAEAAAETLLAMSPSDIVRATLEELSLDQDLEIRNVFVGALRTYELAQSEPRGSN